MNILMILLPNNNWHQPTEKFAQTGGQRYNRYQIINQPNTGLDVIH